MRRSDAPYSQVQQKLDHVCVRGQIRRLRMEAFVVGYGQTSDGIEFPRKMEAHTNSHGPTLFVLLLSLQERTVGFAH